MDGPIFNPREVVSVPVNGDIEKAISSDWAFDHVEDIDAHHEFYGRKSRLGQYEFPDLFGYVGAGQALVADTLYAIPFKVARDKTYDRIAIDITAQAGQKIRQGIYNDGTDVSPGTLLDDSGEITLGGVGVQEIIISEVLRAGNYWVVVVSDGTPSARRLSTDGVGISPLGVSATNFGQRNNALEVGQAYGALPDPFPGGGSLTNARGYIICLRPLTLD